MKRSCVVFEANHLSTPHTVALAKPHSHPFPPKRCIRLLLLPTALRFSCSHRVQALLFLPVARLPCLPSIHSNTSIIDFWSIPVSFTPLHSKCPSFSALLGVHLPSFLHHILPALLLPVLPSFSFNHFPPKVSSDMLAFVTDIFSRGFRKPKPPPLNQKPGNGSNGGGGGGGAGAGGGNFGSPSAGLIPGSPSAQRVTQKPLFLCKPFVTSQLVKGSFSTIVVLPRYVDQGEWLALNRGSPQLP